MPQRKVRHGFKLPATQKTYNLWSGYSLEGCAMSDKRRYGRVAPSGLAPKTGKIFDHNLPILDCKVIDLSVGGACLELSEPRPVPKRFELVLGAVRKKCTLVWRANKRLGVSF